MAGYQTSIELQGGLRFLARSQAGHGVLMDAGPAGGGEDAGVRPLELLLIGLGGCMGIDVLSILRKRRCEVTAYRLQVRGEQAPEHPRVFTSIVVEHELAGRNLTDDDVRIAVDLAREKYCSVYAMLLRAAPIEVRWQISADDGGGAAPPAGRASAPVAGETSEAPQQAR